MSMANIAEGRAFPRYLTIGGVGFFDEKSINGRALVVTLANPQSITVTISS